MSVVNHFSAGLEQNLKSIYDLYFKILQKKKKVPVDGRSKKEMWN